MHLLVDSTGLKLCGPGEWLIEKHGAKTRRSWKGLHLGVDADTGQIVAAALTGREADDGAQVGPLLDQVAGPVASFTGDGAYDQDRVYADIAERHRQAAIIVPPRSTAVPSTAAESEPTQRDRHLPLITERGRMAWQKASGYTRRARAETTSPGRDDDQPVQARDRGWIALAHGRAPGDRGGRGGPRAQSYAGAGTPEVCPHRLTLDQIGVSAPAPLIRATQLPET